MFKDEAAHMIEWIEYHRMVGFEHFYLYDNNSTDNPRPILDHYVREGLVTLHNYTGNLSGKPLGEMVAKPDYPLRHVYSTYADESEWIAHLDLDEFLVVRDPEGRGIGQILDAYFKKADVVTATWVMFGSSGHYFEPEGLVTENYTLRAELHKNGTNRHVKSIVRPHCVLRWANPHKPFTKPGSVYMHADGKVSSTSQDHPFEEAKEAMLNVFHYHAKSLWYFINSKMGKMRTPSMLKQTIDPKTYGKEQVEAGTFGAHQGYSSTASWYTYTDNIQNEVFDNTLASLSGALRSRIAALPQSVRREMAPLYRTHPEKVAPRLPKGWEFDFDAYMAHNPKVAAFVGAYPTTWRHARIAEYLFTMEDNVEDAVRLFSKVETAEEGVRELGRRLGLRTWVDGVHPHRLRYLDRTYLAHTPLDFDWETYIQAYRQLPDALNASHHWIHTGCLTGRPYPKRQN